MFENYEYLQYECKKLLSRVFASGPGDRSLIPGRVKPKTQKNGT